MRGGSGLLRAGSAALAILLGLAAAAPAEEARTEATAVLEPGLVGVDELASFTITVSSSGFGGLDVHPEFELDNFEVAAGPFQSQSQRWVNGTTSSTLQLTWRLRPKGVGPARVRALTLTVSGKAFRLSDKEIQVQQQAPPRQEVAPAPPAGGAFDPFEDLVGRAGAGRRRPPPAETRRPKIFLRAELDPPAVYVGQQTTYTLWLYTQTDVGAFQPTHMPAFKGFWVREIPQPAELKPEWLEQDGERFGRVAMLRRALFPLQAGKFTIEPTEVDLVARVAEIGPFGTPFGRSETQHLKTAALPLDVQVLPAAPVDFTGAVGDLAVSARLDRAALSVGEAATLTIRSTGRGNLQSLRPPELAIPDGIRLFPPRQESTERLTDGNLVSSQEWSYVLVPQRPGTYELPALALPYFDPAAKAFKSAATRPLVLTVTGEAVASPTAAPVPDGAGPSAEPAAAGAPAGSPGPYSADSARALAAPSGRGWLWAFGGGLLATGLLAAGAWRLRLGAARTQGGGRSLVAALRAIEAGATRATPRETAAEIEEALRHHLESRFEIAPGTPASHWQARLVAAKVDPATATELAEVTRELHYLRYAPELAAAEELRTDTLIRARRLARALR
ncbi:MAG: BatD family protein [Thermoanaerobaculia bacterium]